MKVICMGKQWFYFLDREPLIRKVPVIKCKSEIRDFLQECQCLGWFFYDGTRVRLDAEWHPRSSSAFHAPRHFVHTTGERLSTGFSGPSDSGKY